jgi:hypothetical protein
LSEHPEAVFKEPMKPNNIVLTSLAALCNKLTNHARNSSVANEAQELHLEWTILISRYSSAGYTIELNRQMKVQAQDLSQRMVALAGKSLGV